MPRNYVDNAMNRSLGRVGMPHGSMPVSRSGGGGSYSLSSSSTKTYVDNSYNRSVGRVGMPHGSMPVSRSGGGGSYSSPSSGTKTYVDNSYNRSAGRVGMPHGSMSVSRSGGDGSYNLPSSGTKTYVDNSYNRRVGRVGMPQGSMVISKGDTALLESSGIATKTYVDNSYNRNHGRVGMEHGTAVVSKSANSKRNESYNDSVVFPPSASLTRKVYKDNPLNRRLNRVGLALGTAVHSKNTKTTPKTYTDNAFNRAVGRVGKPLGSMSISRRSEITSEASHIYVQLIQNPDLDLDFSMMHMREEQQTEACDIALSLVHRMEDVLKWQEETCTTQQPQTSERVLRNYRGKIIDFDEIELEQKIGSGGFGDVHFAKWNGTVVAVKKLRVQRVSKRRLKDFTDELLLFCELDHPNIVKFIGASVITPNLSIVMEYMQMSLFEALHIRNDEFSENEKIIIIKHTAMGLEYLHHANIAHCDMKSRNILMNYGPEIELVAKITDFGLSMMKNETETSTSGGAEYVRNLGTPRYSSPENLRGELLDIKGLMMSDTYSYSLVIFEIVCEEEPFYNLNYQQLRKQVGELGLTPAVPDNISLDSTVTRLLKDSWNRNPGRRPTAKQIVDSAEQIKCLYNTNTSVRSDKSFTM